MFLLLSFIFLVSKQRFIANVVHWRVLTDENLKKTGSHYSAVAGKELAVIFTHARFSFSDDLKHGFSCWIT